MNTNAHWYEVHFGGCMDPQALLKEQRRVGDEFRAVEKTVLGFKNLLSGSGLTAPTRARAEAMLSTSTSELLRLGARRLELDASVMSLRRGESVHVQS